MATRHQERVSGDASSALFRRQVAIIFVLAAAVRIAYLVSIRHAPFFENLQTDPERYREWARLIVQGRSPLPPFEQAPGYAYFVAVIYAVCGTSMVPVAVVQALLDAATCALIAVIGARCLNRRTGEIAGLLAALYGPFIYFSAELLPATLGVASTVAALTAGVLTSWALSGLLWGLALTIRTEVVLAYPFVLIDAWYRGGRRGLWQTAIGIAVWVGLLMSVNAAAGAKPWRLTSSGGVNLWLGNNAHADGVNPFVSGPLEAVADGIRATAGGDPAIVDHLFRHEAWRFWRDAPGTAAALLWKKLLWTFTSRELPNTSDIEWQTTFSWMFGLGILPLGFGVIFALAASFLPLIPRQRAGLLLLAAPVAIAVGVSALFFTNARFRLVMVPSLLLLAAFALDQAPSVFRRWRDRKRHVPLALTALALGAVLTWGNFYGVRSYQIPQIDVNTGILEREAGHFDAAIAHLRTGLAGDALDAIGWVHLALALEQRGDSSGALRAYFDGLAKLPNDADLTSMTARFFDRHHLDRRLLDAYRQSGDRTALAILSQHAGVPVSKPE